MEKTLVGSASRVLASSEKRQISGSNSIYPEGIEPATATVSKGTILISIEDLSDARSGVLVERLGNCRGGGWICQEQGDRDSQQHDLRLTARHV